MKLVYLLILSVGILAVNSAANAFALYGATSAGGPGELYIINPATGATVLDIGPTNDSGSLNYPITGLAFHPITGVLYGSTGNAGGNPLTKEKLVTIDRFTGLVTVIGSFGLGGATMADIDFSTTGGLYGVSSAGGPQLYAIDIATGAATVIGTTGLTSTSGGGVALNSSNAIFGTPTVSRFGTYDDISGGFTNIANPTKPVGGAYAALSFDGPTLYGLDLGPSPGFAAELVTINTATGAVTDLGASVIQLDAIAFANANVPVTMSAFQAE